MEILAAAGRAAIGRIFYRTQMNAENKGFKHKVLSEKIIKIFFRVYNKLGYGFLEKVYENAMMIE